MGAYGNTPEASKSTGLDTTRPTVTSTNPANSAINIPSTKTITVTFSESIQQSTNYGSMTLKNSANNVISTTNSISGSTLTIDPAASLAYSTQYTVTVPASALKDISNNNLASQYVFTFTTSAQPILTSVAISPASASITTGSTLQFVAQPLDQSGNAISATVTWSSSNTAVAAVTPSGVATGATEGTSTITASSGEYLAMQF